MMNKEGIKPDVETACRTNSDTKYAYTEQIDPPDRPRSKLHNGLMRGTYSSPNPCILLAALTYVRIRNKVGRIHYHRLHQRMCRLPMRIVPRTRQAVVGSVVLAGYCTEDATIIYGWEHKETFIPLSVRGGHAHTEYLLL